MTPEEAREILLRVRFIYVIVIITLLTLCFESVALLVAIR